MNYENEKYNHIKDFWKIDKSISALFWEYEHLGFSQCDIHVIHAIRKWGKAEMWCKRDANGKLEFLKNGLPYAIHKHINPNYAKPNDVYDSILKWEGCGFIKRVKVEQFKKAKTSKLFIYYDVDIARMKRHIQSIANDKSLFDFVEE